MRKRERESFHSVPWGLHHIDRLTVLMVKFVTPCQLNPHCFSHSRVKPLMSAATTPGPDAMVRSTNDLKCNTPVFEEVPTTGC